jgi:hypothetical protein
MLVAERNWRGLMLVYWDKGRRRTLEVLFGWG